MLYAEGQGHMLKIWGRPTSARTQKVLWGLGEIGLEFELILASATMGPGGHVSKGNEPYGVVHTPEYLAMNPNGTVPTIEDGDFVLWESNSILRYLAMKYAPDLMYGDDLEVFASASRWMDWEADQFLPTQHTLVMNLVRLPPEERDADAVEAARQAHLRPLEILDAQFARSEFVAGVRFVAVNARCYNVLSAARRARANHRPDRRYRRRKRRGRGHSRRIRCGRRQRRRRRPSGAPPRYRRVSSSPRLAAPAHG